MDKEIKLYSNNQGRERVEAMADLFSIFMATESLEKAYIRDAVSRDDYQTACSKLITQFKTSLSFLGQNFSIQDFLDEYEVNCPAAKHRLIQVGVPATIEHVSASNDASLNVTKYVAETVQHFITLLDSLKLNLVAIDQIHPLLSDLMQSLSQVTVLPPSYQGRSKILEWLKKINRMRASEELTEDDVRQLSFDLESSLTEFHRVLAGTK